MVLRYSLDGNSICLDCKATSKKTATRKSVQRSRLYQPHNVKYSEKYNNQLDWKERYRIRVPFRVGIDSRSSEFQFKVLQRYI